MKIALSMMDQAWKDKAANLRVCAELAAEARRLDADLLVLPEMTLTGFAVDAEHFAEDGDDSSSVRALGDIARQNKIGIVAGVVLSDAAGIHNSAVAMDRTGTTLHRYDKVHPFSMGGEDRCIVGGTGLGTWEFEGVAFGATICYDLRFPDLWTALGDDCSCIINIASWPASRIDHWRTLLQARAIENQLYVLGVNRVGVDGNGLAYPKSSMGFGPDGRELVPLATAPSLLVLEVTPSRVEDYRRSFPVRRDRRRDLYETFSKHPIAR